MDPVPHKPVMSVMSEPRRYEVTYPYPSARPALCLAHQDVSKQVHAAVDMYLAGMSIARLTRVPRNLDKQRSVILPAREILFIYRPKPRVKSVATETVQLQSADYNSLQTTYTKQTAVAQLPTLECAG